MKKIILFQIFILVAFLSFSQRCSSQWAGVQVGALLELGTHVNAIGIQTKGYVGTSWTQLNIGNTFRFNLNSLGGRKRFLENRSYAGLVLMFGKNQNTIDFDLDGLNHQSFRKFAVGYNFICYWDNRQTSQLSGGFVAHLGRFSIKMENDIFAGKGQDRFRTGHVQLGYRWEFTKLSIGTYLWTGETNNSVWDKTPQLKMPNGYRNLSALSYGKTSHGIFYINGSYSLPFGNTAFLRMGIDSEQVRHVFQNRVFHDLIFLPKKIQRHTPHYPRLNEEGEPIMNKAERKKDRFYLQFGLNDNWGN